MLFVGLDLSMRKAGFCIVDEVGQLVGCSWLTNDLKVKFLSVYALHLKLKFEIEGLLEYNRVGLVAIEDLALGKMQFTGADLAMAVGVMRFWLHDCKIPYMMVSPSKLRGYVSDRRYEGKGLTIEWSRKRGLPDKISGHASQQVLGDVADAHVLALMARDVHRCYSGQREEFCKQATPNQVKIVLDGKTGLLADRDDLLFKFDAEKP